MKSLVAAALMISALSAFGSEMGSVDSFLSVLPIGSYYGKDDQGVSCSISVNESNFPEKSITVSASNNNNSIFKKIVDGSEFRLRAYKIEFIQTERSYVDASRGSYIDRIVRTTSAGDNRLYVVVGNVVTDNRDVRSESVECVINK